MPPGGAPAASRNVCFPGTFDTPCITIVLRLSIMTSHDVHGRVGSQREAVRGICLGPTAPLCARGRDLLPQLHVVFASWQCVGSCVLVHHQQCLDRPATCTAGYLVRALRRADAVLVTVGHCIPYRGAQRHGNVRAQRHIRAKDDQVGRWLGFAASPGGLGTIAKPGRRRCALDGRLWPRAGTTCQWLRGAGCSSTSKDEEQAQRQGEQHAGQGAQRSSNCCNM